ncbi:hypothetical protein HU200_054003 [Digitaria exilis]|uniref:Uncharacterized protein n=1 Tax=Digitaria exilis TaxID=1010633 RepID=A0A835AL99_9POAL|nr:hypothetical protein HU200_054003 [Digitaria exilis]
MNDSPSMSGALEDLEESLHRALELVMACQERSTIRRLITAGELSKQLRRVKDDILNKVMLASFAINAHTTIVLLTFQAAGHPLLRQQEVPLLMSLLLPPYEKFSTTVDLKMKRPTCKRHKMTNLVKWHCSLIP